MTRKKQVHNENGAVLDRDFPRRSRSLIIGAAELRRLFPNVKPEYIDLTIKRFSDYRFGDDENEIEVFGKIMISVMIQDAIATKEDGNGNPLRIMVRQRLPLREGLQEREQVFGVAGVHRQARRRPAKADERRRKGDLREIHRMHQRDVRHRGAGGICERFHTRCQDHHRGDEYGNRITQRGIVPKCVRFLFPSDSLWTLCIFRVFLC